MPPAYRSSGSSADRIKSDPDNAQSSCAVASIGYSAFRQFRRVRSRRTARLCRAIDYGEAIRPWLGMRAGSPSRLDRRFHERSGDRRCFLTPAQIEHCFNLATGSEFTLERYSHNAKLPWAIRSCSPGLSVSQPLPRSDSVSFIKQLLSLRRTERPMARLSCWNFSPPKDAPAVRPPTGSLASRHLVRIGDPTGVPRKLLESPRVGGPVFVTSMV